MDALETYLLTLTLTFGGVTALVFLVNKWLQIKRLNLPPGPVGNFISGSALRYGGKRYLQFTEDSKKYGDIFCFRAYHQVVVVLSSIEAIREAFIDNSDWLSGRPQNKYDMDFSNGGLGLISSSGELWKEHRRFSLSVLKDFGLGRSKIERTIQDEVEHLRSEILAATFAGVGAEQIRAQSFDPKTLLVKAVSNVICALVFAEWCSTDAEFEDIIERCTSLTSKGPRHVSFYPMWGLFKHLPGDYSRLKAMMTSRVRVQEYVGKKYKQHLLTFNTDNIRDYIDAFLAEMRKTDSASRWFTEKQLSQSIYDLFLAGTETTSTTLLWAVAFLAKYPDVQRLVQKEIDEVIGDSKLPESSDKVKMRYVDAVLCEIQRYATIGPFALPHVPIRDGKLRGYDIMKNSLVLSNIWAVHRDERLWKDPNNFNPENFLDEKGNVINTNNLISFGVGKRECLGELLARQELFIFFTGLLQRFNISADAVSRLPEIDECEVNGVIRSPNPFRVFITPRAHRI